MFMQASSELLKVEFIYSTMENKVKEILRTYSKL